jgi:hypothetical protein
MPVNNSVRLRKGTSTQWSTTNPVLSLGEPGFDSTNNLLKIGDGATSWTSLKNLNQESYSLVTTVFNSTGSIIPKMSAVYINGGQGDQPTVALASASSESTSSKTYGITTAAIGINQTGKVIVSGALIGLNTDQFNPTAPHGNVNGTSVWLSTTPGGLTTTIPSDPDHSVFIGTIVRTHQNEGVIEIKIQNGYELNELHDVSVASVTAGQFLYYNGTTNLWEPELVLFSDGTNIGIGTNSPSHTLEIIGTMKSDGFKSYGTGWFGAFDGSLGLGVNVNPAGTFDSSSDFLALQGFNDMITSYNPICLTTGYDPQLFLNTDLNVGIGTATPYSKLQVNGSLSIAANGQDVSNGSEGIIFGTDGSISSNDSGPGLIFSVDAINGLRTYGNGGAGGAVILSTDRSNLRVGIGTDTPDSTLHVVGDVNIDGNLIFDSYTESVVANGNSGTSKTLSLASGTVHTCTLTGNCTFTMPTATAGKSFSMFLNSGSGNYTASFSGVRWADSAIPTATITASKVDIYSFISDGTYWYGSFSQNYG